MTRLSFYIITVGIMTALAGLISATGLLLGLGGYTVLALTLLCCVAVAVLLFRTLDVPAPEVRSYVMASAAILILAVPCCRLVLPHTSWDGLCNWNLIAKFLSTPHGVERLFKPGGPNHADYPPGLPGIIAFCWSLCHSTSEVITLVISFVFLAALSTLIVAELCNRNIVYGSIAFIILAICPQYIRQGLAQCADVPLAFYFVAAIVSLEAYRHNHSRTYLVCAAGAIAALPLIKNDGQLLALSLLIFYGRLLLKKANILPLILTLLPVIIFLAWYKSIAPRNDLVTDFGKEGIARITDPGRYIIIAKYLWQSLSHQYILVSLFILTGIAIQVRKRVTMSHAQLAIILALLGYLGVYLTSSYPLSWVVGNSIDRLLIHLLPAWMVATGITIWPLPYRKAQKESIAIA